MRNQIIIIFLFISINIVGQSTIREVPSIFWNQYSRFNPAASGIQNKIEFNVVGSVQSENRSIYGATDMKFNKIRSGLGINYMKVDQVLNRYSSRDYLQIDKSFQKGMTQRFNLNYNYQIDLGESRELNFGISAGILQMTYVPNLGRTAMGYWSTLSIEEYTWVDYTIGCGIMYVDNDLKIGISAMNINKPSAELPSDNSSDPLFVQPREMWITFSNMYKVSGSFSLQPNILFMIAEQDVNQGSAILLGAFKEIVWFGSGVNYISNSFNVESNYQFSPVVVAGVNIWKKFKLSYAYNANFNNGNDTNLSRHELVLNFSID